MIKFLLCLIIGFSLMVVPVAHAAGVLDDGCHSAHAEKKDGQPDSHSKKMADAGHHCGCSALSFRLVPQSYALIARNISGAILSDDAHMASIAPGALLEPPSYA